MYYNNDIEAMIGLRKQVLKSGYFCGLFIFIEIELTYNTMLVSGDLILVYITEWSPGSV